MKRCAHAAYCTHAPHRCREFLGNPLDFMVGGCPLAPMQEEIERLKDAAGGLSVSPAEGGELSIGPSDG